MNAWAELTFHCDQAPWDTCGHSHTSHLALSTRNKLGYDSDQGPPPFLTQNGHSVVCVGRHLSACWLGERLRACLSIPVGKYT